MEIDETWETAGTLPLLYKELQQLGLETNVAELEAFGYTIIPPEKVGPDGYHLELKEILEQIVADRFADLTDDLDRWDDVNDNIRFMLWKDPLFEKMSYNPAGLGLAQYLLGTNCILSLCNGWVKGPGEARTVIHGDYLDPTPDALPGVNVNANVHYFLTDYSKDDGAISFLPGSHRWRRQANSPGMQVLGRSCPSHYCGRRVPRSFGGTTHGTDPIHVRSRASRMALQYEYMRPRYQAQEPYRETVTQEALDRNSVRFAGLMDVYGPFPFGVNGRDSKREMSGPPGTGHGRSPITRDGPVRALL